MFVLAGTRILALKPYSSLRLVGGIDPASALAVTLDVGTNNEVLLKDDLYVVSCFDTPFELNDAGLKTL